MKKILTIGTLTSVALPIISVVSCGSASSIRDFGNHAYLYEKQIQDNVSNIHVHLDTLQRDQIRNAPVSLTSHFGSSMVAGGFGEYRHFYPMDNVLHTGVDVFANEGTKVYAPANAEIITAIWRHSKGENNFAHGSGGNIVLKVNVNDLPIDEAAKEIVYIKYRDHHKRMDLDTHVTSFVDSDVVMAIPKIRLYKDGAYSPIKDINISRDDGSFKKFSMTNKDEYDNFINSYSPTSESDPTKQELIDSPNYLLFSYMHLSKWSITKWGESSNVDSRTENLIVNDDIMKERNFRHISKGEVIGTVGSLDENGGWSTHTHVEILQPQFKVIHPKIRISDIRKWKEKKTNIPIYGIGTYQSNHFEHNYGSWEGFKLFKGLVDPNEIYKFYDSKTAEKNLIVE